jgi:hypothetical protein
MSINSAKWLLILFFAVISCISARCNRHKDMLRQMRGNHTFPISYYIGKKKFPNFLLNFVHITVFNLPFFHLQVQMEGQDWKA